MRKILFITNMYPSKANQSYGTFVKETYDWLKTEYKVKLIRMTYSKNNITKLFKYFWFNFYCVFIGVFGKFDVVYAHYISHSAQSIRIIRLFHKNILIVGNIHGDDALSKESRFYKNIKKSELFVKNADFFIVPSIVAKNKFCKIYKVKENKVFVSPSGGINTKLFKPTNKKEAKKRLHLDNKIVIGFISRLVENKGWDTFIKIASKIEKDNKNNNFVYLLIGSGNSCDEAKELIKKLNLNKKIVMLPSVPHAELNVYYNSMDVFCVLSKIKTETLGLVGLEAMACGIACVITRIDAFLTYAEDGINSLCVDIDDVENSSVRIIEYLKMNNNKKKELCRNAVNTAKKYDSNIVKKEFIGFFSNIMDGCYATK